MKFSNLRAFEKHLEGAAPQQYFTPFYLILGEDRFARKLAVDRVVSILLKDKGNAGLCLKIFQADQSPVDKILEELESLTFFTERKIILLEEAEKLSKPSMKALEAYFSHPNPSLIFIISASAINHATNFYKHAEKGGVVLEFAEEKSADKEKTLAEWAKKQFSLNGKNIDPKTCHSLVRQLGTDMALLAQEIEKLICYVGDRDLITPQDIVSICTKVSIENIWQLGDALFQRDAGASLRICKAMLNDGVPFFTLVRQIRHQFQTDFQVCSLMANGGGAHEISKLFPYMKGFILDKRMNSAKSYGLTRFKKAMQLIDEAELVAKNSGIEHDVLVEMLVIKLVSQGIK